MRQRFIALWYTVMRFIVSAGWIRSNKKTDGTNEFRFASLSTRENSSDTVGFALV